MIIQGDSKKKKKVENFEPWNVHAIPYKWLMFLTLLPNHTGFMPYQCLRNVTNDIKEKFRNSNKTIELHIKL